MEQKKKIIEAMAEGAAYENLAKAMVPLIEEKLREESGAEDAIRRLRKALAEPGILTTIPEETKGVLRLEQEDNDYELPEGTVWIRHKNLVVWIRANESGVTVDITPKVCAEKTLDCCNADFDDAKEFECTECGKYNNDGEGYNGLCGNCADKKEADRPSETGLAIERTRDGTAEG